MVVACAVDDIEICILYCVGGGFGDFRAGSLVGTDLEGEQS